MFRFARYAVAILMCCLLATAPAAAQGDPKPNAGATIHIVQRGETLFRIAQRYGTTVEAIAAANGINNPAAISVGQRLLVPNPAPNAPGVPTGYTVGPADSLTVLAVRFNTTPRAIARANRITNPRLLFIGQALDLQEGSQGGRSVRAGWVHPVARGETIFHIAARYNLPADVLTVANALKRESTLFPGQKLIVPGPDDGPALADLPAPLAKFEMAPLAQGRTTALRLVTALPARIDGVFYESPLIIVSDGSRTSHFAMLGADALMQPGLYPLQLTVTTDDGRQTRYARAVLVADGGYPNEAIMIAASQADLLNPAVTGPESERVNQLVRVFTPQKYFSGPFGLPCPAPVTSHYGTRRSYNGGVLNTVHAGTDFAALPGAAIYAPAAGVVVLAEMLNVRGNATLIDHGWGVYTGYWHQQEIKVRVGDVVQPGQIIGTVGQTGRVTGPHLHWEVFVNGLQVDPLQWTRQTFP